MQEDYVYNNGHLTEIKLNNATSIWKLDAVNEFGSPTSVKTGTTTRTYKYNEYGYPTGRSAVTSTRAIQDYTYDFNMQNGNLKSRKDNLRNKQENFEYDNPLYKIH